jgi:Virulence factor BrkB
MGSGFGLLHGFFHCPLLVIGVSFVLLVSLILSAILALITDYFAYLLPGAGIFWQLLDVGLSFSLITFLFASIFKIVPDVHIDWSDVWLGSLITALLFIGGKTALAYYLGRPQGDWNVLASHCLILLSVDNRSIDRRLLMLQRIAVALAAVMLHPYLPFAGAGVWFDRSEHRLEFCRIDRFH